MSNHPLLALSVAALLASPSPATTPPDPHSDSRPDRVAVSHLDLDLAVDFGSRTLSGSATFRLERRDSEAPLILYTRDLDILSVRLDGDPEPAPFR
ncbi:MAG TPA: aminopeptidase, partial [Thermoanaerobaculia bacterium]|nr:aminopeptidase [Thermoanaerobaculia bacterium]